MKFGWQLKKEGTLHIVHVIWRRKEKNSGKSCCLRKPATSFPSMTNVWFQTLKTFSELWSWPVWNFVCERRMNWHVRNMIWLPQRSQAKLSKYKNHTAHKTTCLRSCLRVKIEYCGGCDSIRNHLQYILKNLWKQIVFWHWCHVCALKLDGILVHRVLTVLYMIYAQSRKPGCSISFSYTLRCLSIIFNLNSNTVTLYCASSQHCLSKW